MYLKYPCLAKEWYFALGNHDWEGNTKVMIREARKTPLWNLDDYKYLKVIMKGDVRIDLIVIDTNTYEPRQPGLSDDQEAAQIVWLKDVLNNHCGKNSWRVILTHMNVYSSAKHCASESFMEEKFKHIWKNHKVHAWFNGNTHQLEHLENPEYDVHFFTSGSGTKTHGLTKMHRFSKFFASTLGFANVKVSRNVMKVEFFNDQAESIYTKDILK